MNPGEIHAHFRRIKVVSAGLFIMSTAVGAFAWWDVRAENLEYQRLATLQQQVRAQEQALMALATAPEPRPAAVMEATYYGEAYRGRLTASGAHKAKAVPQELWRFDPDKATFAAMVGEFGEVWEFTAGGETVRAMLTDRLKDGTPKHRVDLSRSVFEQLAPLVKGRIRVSVRKVTP